MKKLGAQIAQTILSGDVHLARQLAVGRRTWSVSEARAIAGACRVARERWGADVALEQFM